MTRGAPIPIGIVGLGAIGGSLALALRTAPSHRVIAFARDSSDRAAAAAAGLRVVASLDELARDIVSSTAAGESRAGIVVLAIPLDAIADAARALLTLAPGLLVLHAGSLQRPDVVGVQGEVRDRVIGTHPIAGTHGGGFGAARDDMFVGAAVSVEARASADVRDRIEALWRAAGATRIEFRDAADHDALMAWVSHLPQLVATSLAATLAEQGIPPSATGSGARDTTRLAGSTLEVWRPLLEHAPIDTRQALRAVASSLESIERAIAAGDFAAVERRWETARRWRAAAEPG